MNKYRITVYLDEKGSVQDTLNAFRCLNSQKEDVLRRELEKIEDFDATRLRVIKTVRHEDYWYGEEKILSFEAIGSGYSDDDFMNYRKTMGIYYYVKQ